MPGIPALQAAFTRKLLSWLSGGRSFGAPLALTTGQETKQHLADGYDQIPLQLLEHVHVQVEGVVGLLHDLIPSALIDRQLIQLLSVAALEGLGVIDRLELIELHAIHLAKVHGLLGDVLENLAPGEGSHVAGVVMTHQ